MPELKLIGAADRDDDGVLVILRRLEHPFESGRYVPMPPDREIGARPDVDAARPSAEVVGTQADRRINRPYARNREEILRIGVDVNPFRRGP